MPLTSFQDWQSNNGGGTPSISPTPTTPTPKSSGLVPFSQWKGGSAEPKTPIDKGLPQGQTFLSAPDPSQQLTTERPWGGGFIGKAAQAAFDTAKGAVTGAADKFNNLFGTLTAKDKLDTGLHAISDENGVPDFTKTTGATIGMTPKQREQYYTGLKQEGSGLNKTVKAGSALLSLGNFYPPIAQFNTELAAAKKLPGPLSLPAKAIDYGFNKVSELGSDVLGKAVDVSPLSQQTKDTIKPFTQELAGFVTLLVGSHLGFKAMEKGLGGAADRLPISDSAKEKLSKGVQLGAGLAMAPFSTAYGLASGLFTAKIHERQEADIPITKEEGQKIVTEVAQELPEKFQQHPETIKAGIDQAKDKIENPEVTPEETAVKAAAEKVQQAPPEPLPKETVKVPGEQLPVGEGETKISRLEARITDKLGKVTPEQAEEAGLTTYKQMNKAENIKRAAEFVDKDPQNALEVLKGNKDAPEGLTHGAIAIAAEAHAELAGNVDLIRKLASLRGTRAGQEVSILSEAEPNSIVNRVREIQIEREKRSEKVTTKGKTIAKAKSDIVKRGKEEVSKGRFKIEDAQKLLDSLVC